MKYQFNKTSSGMQYIDNVEGYCVDIPNVYKNCDFPIIAEPSSIDRDAIAQQIQNPISSLQLREIAAGKSSAVIIVSDATRAVCTRAVLGHIVSELLLSGFEYDQITMVVALGVHRPATEKEMQEMAGEYYGIIKIQNHEPFNSDELVFVGETKMGTPVNINKTVYNSQVRISIGKVEPHVFAGFTGGRKSVLPGVSAETTIIHNHQPSVILNENAVPGRLNGNPVHLDMLEAAMLLGIDFCVNVAQNMQGEIVAVFAGDMQESHKQAVEFVRKSYGICPKKNSVYLTTPGKPLNIDLYQSMKALFGLFPLLKEGDVVVLYSECIEGVNSPDMLRAFEQGNSVEEVLAWLTKNYKIQMDNSLLLCKIYQMGVRVIVHSPNVNRKDVETMKMIYADSLPVALSLAHEMTKSDSLTICTLPQKWVLD